MENKKYYKLSDKRILKSLIRKVLSLKGLMLFIGIVFGFNLIAEFTTMDQLISVYKFAPVIVLSLAAIVYYIVIRRKKERFSSLERAGFYFMAIYYLIEFIGIPQISLETMTIQKLTWITLSNSFVIYVLISLMLVTFQLKKEYQLKYNSLV